MSKLYIYAPNKNEATALAALLRIKNWEGGDSGPVARKYSVRIPTPKISCIAYQGWLRHAGN